MYRTLDTLKAPKNAALYVWFEPWAEGLGFPRDTDIELHAESPKEGRLEIDATEERMVVYGWPGSTLKVVVKNETVAEFDLAVPDVSSSLSTKETMRLLFGEPPKPTHEELKQMRKPWWQFWR